MVDAPLNSTASPSTISQKIFPGNFSKYIVYADESGDHDLHSIDPQYPVFVLAFCIFEKSSYATKVSPALREFKFKHFGHDMVILHEQEIRKSTDKFRFLLDTKYRELFMEDLNFIIQNSPFDLIGVPIIKSPPTENVKDSKNLYHFALQVGLERIYDFLQEACEEQKITHIIFEGRGKEENSALEKEFKQICSKNNVYNKQLPFELIISDKRANCCGLQIADLIARPIGRYTLNKDQENRAYKIIERKLYIKNVNEECIS